MQKVNRKFSQEVNSDRTDHSAGGSSYWRMAIAVAGIFVATVLLAMLLQEAPLGQWWVFALIGLSVLLPYGAWLAVVLHYDPSPPPPQRFALYALAWGSLLAFSVAIIFEEIFDVVDAILGVSDLDTMLVAPFWEELAKGFFIVLVYARARGYLRGPWDGLVYGVLVGTGFGFAEDIEYLNSSLSEDGFSDLVGTYLFREILTTHAHPMFTAVTGFAAGMAVRRDLSGGRALQWIFAGFVVAFLLHAIFDSATVLAPLAVVLIAPVYGVVFVIALRRLRWRELAIQEEAC